MNLDSVNPILKRSEWDRGPSCDVQVVPQNKRPGDFLARIIVKASPPEFGEPPPLFRQIVQCGEISALHLFLESPQADDRSNEVAPEVAEPLLPEAVVEAFTPGRFANGCRYFLVPPGHAPTEPVYPVWARDEKRSRQVLEGHYGEIIPISFEFIPTLNCTFRCDQCAYRVPKEALGVWQESDFAPAFHMDWPTMQKILDALANAAVNEVLFTGGGEPLMNNDTPRAMRYATEIGIPRVGLYTNGALVNEKKARNLVAAKPAYIRVSLNAGTPEVHRRHHNPLNPTIDYFSRVIAGVKALAEAKRDSHGKCSLGISYLVDAENGPDVVLAARLVAEIAAAYPHSLDYMRYTPSVNYFGPQQHEQAVFERIVARIVEEAVPILEAAGVAATVYHHRFRGLYEPRSYTQCLAASWYGGVGPGGTLFWCCEKLFNPKFAFGSLLEQPLDAIWGGPRRLAIAQLVGEAVLGRTDSPCPVVCKPHEHNKVFAEIEHLRAAGKIALVAVWLERIHDIKRRQLRDPGLAGFDSASD